jgi:hypothetical protein
LLRRYGRLTLLVSVTLALASVPGVSAQATDRTPGATVNWVLGPTSPFGGTRFDGEYVSANNRVYFLGYRTFGDATDGSVVYLDVATQSYVNTGVDMQVPISNYGIAALNDANGLGLYIFGGRTATGDIVDTVQVYYPATNQAMVINSDPWPGMTPSGCISLPAMGVAVFQNRAGVIGGMSFSTSVPPCVDDHSNQTWIFNPNAPAGARWTQGPNLNDARGYITPAVFQGRIYAIGGDHHAPPNLVADKTVEAWQPPGGGWNDAAVADLPGPGCDESQAFPHESGPAIGIVLAGCGQWPNAQPHTGFYDPVANNWTLAGQFNEPRRNHAGAFLPVGGGRMYVLGGYDCPNTFCLTNPTQLSEHAKLMAAPSGPFDVGVSSGTSGHPATH